MSSYPGKLRSWMTQALTIGSLALFPAVLTFRFGHSSIEAWLDDEPARVSFAVVSRWDRVLWIDARSAPQYSRDHLEGALLLNEDRWEELLPVILEAWAPGRRIVVYCNPGRCDASHSVARRLRKELGTKDVYVLAEGWGAWALK